MAVGAVALVTVALLPASSAGPRARGDALGATVAIAQTPPPTTAPTTVTTNSTTVAPGTEVAGKVVDRAPAKVLVDLDAMPRTGSRGDRILAGAGWLTLGIGLLLVDVAGVLVRRRRARP